MESTAGESCRSLAGERGIIPKSNKRIMEILVHKIASMRLAPQYQYVQQQQQQRRPTHIWMLRAAVWACQLGGGSERAVSSECAGKSVAKWAFKECNRCTHAVSVRAEPAEYLPDGYHGTHTHVHLRAHIYSEWVADAAQKCYHLAHLYFMPPILMLSSVLSAPSAAPSQALPAGRVPGTGQLIQLAQGYVNRKISLISIVFSNSSPSRLSVCLQSN